MLCYTGLRFFLSSFILLAYVKGLPWYMCIYYVCIWWVDGWMDGWRWTFGLSVFPHVRNNQVINLLLVFYWPNLKETTLLTNLIIIKLLPCIGKRKILEGNTYSFLCPEYRCQIMQVYTFSVREKQCANKVPILWPKTDCKWEGSG